MSRRVAGARKRMVVPHFGLSGLRALRAASRPARAGNSRVATGVGASPICLLSLTERAGRDFVPDRSVDSVRAAAYFSAFHLVFIAASNAAQSTVLPWIAVCSAAPRLSPPPEGNRSDPSKRTALAFATCAASRFARSFGYALAGTDLMGEMIAPVPAHTLPESAVVTYWRNSLTPGLFVNAAMTSPPMVTVFPL